MTPPITGSRPPPPPRRCPLRLCAVSVSDRAEALGLRAGRLPVAGATPRGPSRMLCLPGWWAGGCHLLGGVTLRTRSAGCGEREPCAGFLSAAGHCRKARQPRWRRTSPSGASSTWAACWWCTGAAATSGQRHSASSSCTGAWSSPPCRCRRDRPGVAREGVGGRVWVGGSPGRGPEAWTDRCHFPPEGRVLLRLLLRVRPSVPGLPHGGVSAAPACSAHSPTGPHSVLFE